MTPEEKAMELYPPKHIKETWVRKDPDVNAPLRAAFLIGVKWAKESSRAKELLNFQPDGLEFR